MELIKEFFSEGLALRAAWLSENVLFFFLLFLFGRVTGLERGSREAGSTTLNVGPAQCKNV